MQSIASFETMRCRMTLILLHTLLTCSLNLADLMSRSEVPQFSHRSAEGTFVAHYISFKRDSRTALCLKFCPKAPKANSKERFITNSTVKISNIVFNSESKPQSQSHKFGFSVPHAHKSSLASRQVPKRDDLSLQIEPRNLISSRHLQLTLKLDNLFDLAPPVEGQSAASSRISKLRSKVATKYDLNLFFNQLNGSVKFKYSKKIKIASIMLNSVNTKLRLGGEKLSNLILQQNAINNFSIGNLSKDSRYPGVENLHIVLSQPFLFVTLDLDGDADRIDNIIIHNDLLTADYESPFAAGRNSDEQDAAGHYDDSPQFNSAARYNGETNDIAQSQSIAGRIRSMFLAADDSQSQSGDGLPRDSSFHEGNSIAQNAPVIKIKLQNVDRLDLRCPVERNGEQIDEVHRIRIYLGEAAYEDWIQKYSNRANEGDLDCFDILYSESVDNELAKESANEDNPIAKMKYNDY